MDQPARYIMIGGFLGAGKTTSIQKFAQHLTAQGLKVGLITNDQGMGLVDSALGRSNRFPVEEISGGCFCCRFNSLIDAAHNLTSTTRPDVFLAEPVGSCTDLMATVTLPLQSIYGDQFTVSPFSVLVDPVRARRVFGLESGKKFSDNVHYIYRKQLEEAEIIVINKTDLVSEEEREELHAFFKGEFPGARIIEMSAREGRNLESWFETVYHGETEASRILDIDYQRYGDGEALLGWLNATVRMKREDGEEFDGNEIIQSLATGLRDLLEVRGLEVAHLKMTLTPEGDPYDIAAVNLVRSDQQPELSHHLAEELESGELLVNMRAEADPDILEKAVQAAFEKLLRQDRGLKYEIAHTQHFRPGFPTPTHRFTSSTAVPLSK